MERQKNNPFKDRKQIFIMLLIFVALIVGFAVASYAVLIKDLKSELGNKAMVLAVDITHWIDVDQQEYDHLLSLSFGQLLEDPLNTGFEAKAREVMVNSEIKYIYLLSPLPEGRSLYSVESNETEDFDAPAGTALNGVYTLDAVLNEEFRLTDSGGHASTDKLRYTVIRPEIQEIIDKREPSFLLNTDEWGTYLTGYAPYFTEEGAFLGMVGVDLFPDKYYAYVKKNMMVLSGFLLILLMIGLLFSRLLNRVWKAEERIRLEKEMTTHDSLTGLMNRRKFMGLLAHEYAICRREGMPLALLMADLEGFAQYNGTHGEVQGDQALMMTAGYLKSRVKRSSDALCRFGGDEFALFLHNTETEDVVRFAENLLEEAPFPLSMGILVLTPEEPLASDTVIETLDEAVRQAFKTGTRKYTLVDETC